MNLKKMFLVGSVLLSSITVNVFSSAVSFSSPQPWLTLRNKDMSVKLIIDTSVTKGKSVSVKAYAFKNGRKATLKSTTIKGGETSGDVNFTINGKYIGGMDYIGIDWSVPGIKNQKGTLAPVGYMPLSEKDMQNVAADKISGDFSVSSFKADVIVGKSEVDFSWSESGLIVAAKVTDDKVTVKFDPKNGKNAFPAFADRCLTLSKDSTLIKSQYPDRSFDKKGIKFEKKEWKNEISIKNDGDIIVAIIPWHDLGIIAQKGRVFGIAAIINDKISFPSTANKAVPGTWGNIELK